MVNRTTRIAVCILLSLCLTAAVAPAQTSGPTENVLITTPRPYDRVVETIQSLGGRVKHQYKYIDAIAAEVPAGAIAAIQGLFAAGTVAKDLRVPHPASMNALPGKTLNGHQVGPVATVATRGARPIHPLAVPSFATAFPNAYAVNNKSLGIDVLHADGFTGNGIVVAVIDSGIRPGFAHLDLDGSVVGGMDFVGDGLGFSNVDNDGHGTFVAGLISANAEFDLTGTGLLASIQSHAPETLNGTFLPLLGSAPAAGIYAVRVFGSNIALGTTESTIIAAIEHVIDTRLKYDQGHPDGLNIRVANLSLGNATLAAGRDILDSSVDALLEAGIIPVVSAGNAGPATMTTASPGSAFSSVTVGSASFAGMERILRDVEYGFGVGEFYRASTHTQTAVFSSRGPNADGRIDPDVMASGVGNFGQGYDPAGFLAIDTGALSIASGSSFSAPIVAGLAAVLVEAFPGRTPTQIRNAIIQAGDSSVIADGSSQVDQGNGVADADAASDLLVSGTVSSSLPKIKNPTQNVAANIVKEAGLRVRDGKVKESLKNLKPGERVDILYSVPPKTRQVVVSLQNVLPELPPAQQNAFFGDDILLMIHSAKTSAILASGDYLQIAFVPFGGRFIINDPEPGILRISVNGDWTNAGKISTDLTVSSTKDPLPKFTAKGKISHLGFIGIPVTIPANAGVAEFLLSWDEDWSQYPTADLDLYLVDPFGNVMADAFLHSPEKLSVVNPAAGPWTVYIFGFDIPTGSDKFELRVSVDGTVLK